MTSDFTATAHAKWILCGEHSVLRGHPALVFPVPSKQVVIEFLETNEKVSAELEGDDSDTALILFWGLLEKALEHVGKAHDELTGHFMLRNNIPIGSGMGFSAALCVAVTKFLVWKQWVDASSVFDVATQLENHFHGKSSGVDILGAMHEEGVWFCDGQYESINIAWRPQLYLSFSNRISITAKCVQRVMQFQNDNHELAGRLDRQMSESVSQARDALADKEKGLGLLCGAIQEANDVFRRWGLVQGELDRHIAALLEAGAVAAKPTGAGDGGYVVSLWKSEPQDVEGLISAL